MVANRRDANEWAAVERLNIGRGDLAVDFDGCLRRRRRLRNLLVQHNRLMPLPSRVSRL